MLVADTANLHDIQSRLHDLSVDHILEFIEPLMTGVSVTSPTIPAGTVQFRGVRRKIAHSSR
jgi:hypothetical protein